MNVWISYQLLQSHLENERRGACTRIPFCWQKTLLEAGPAGANSNFSFPNHVLSDLTFSLALPNRELEKDVVHCPGAGFGKLLVQWRQLSNEKICIKQAKNTCGGEDTVRNRNPVFVVFLWLSLLLVLLPLVGLKASRSAPRRVFNTNLCLRLYLVSGTAEEVPWNRCSSAIPCWGRILEICHNYSV